MTHLKCLITAYRSADHLAYTSLHGILQQQPYTRVHFSINQDASNKYTLLLLNLYEVRTQYIG